MIRTRIAPSPTGYMHIGTAQSALYNWLFAHKNKGNFILRIEDTDKERSTKEYETSIVEALDWLGLKSDEFYRQSERSEIYKKYLKVLLDSGRVFYCYHTKTELEDEQKKQMDSKEAPRHVCNHKGQKSSVNGEGVIRLAVNSDSERKINFKDMIRGEISWEEKLMGDFVIAKDLDNPLYNYAVVVDDIDMQISHVIRGEDHISNTFKQILIYEALERKVPEFAHLPLILAPDRSKLSKRHGAVAVVDYKKDYLPEAIINFLGGLSFTFSKDIIPLEEMLKEFDLAKVHKSGAIFDIKKLNWINSQYIKNLPAEEFKKLAGVPELPNSAVPLVTERLEKLTDVQGFKYLWGDPNFKKETFFNKKFGLVSAGDVSGSLRITTSSIAGIVFNDNKEQLKEDIRNKLDIISKEKGRGYIYWPLRVAITGEEKSPDPIDIIASKGKEKIILELKNATEKIEQSEQ